jgi:hypothetical protein
MNDFNVSFVQAFQMTDAFREWQGKGPYPALDALPARSVCSVACLTTTTTTTTRSCLVHLDIRKLVN